MTHGSLFSGIGGFDLAAEWMGWENKFHCEWNPFGQKVLKYYWPEAESFEDITKTDFTKYANTIDILTGGFPCQPYSLAGKRKGKDDDRHLWPEMLRTIREVKPRWVVGENVLGLVNWNGGLVFHEVQSDLEAQGYEVWPFVLPAASVNAPHRRDRVWFVAYSNKQRHSSCGKGESIERKWCGNNGQSEKWPEQAERFDGLDGFQQFVAYSDNTRNTTFGGRIDGNRQTKIKEWQHTFHKFDGLGNKGTFTNSDHNGFNECNGTNEINPSQGRINALGDIIESNNNGDATNTNGIGLRRQGNWFGKSGFIGKNEPGNYWKNFPTVSPICDGNDGISDRLDGITFSKWRNESIKAGGNAIVPQVVYQIFKSIEIYDKHC